MYDILKRKKEKREDEGKNIYVESYSLQRCDIIADEDFIDSNRAVECQKCIFSYIRIAIRCFRLLEEK